MEFFKIYGKQPSGKRLERIKKSPNYKNTIFQNLSVTPAISPDTPFYKLLLNFFNKSSEANPSQPIPFVKTDLKAIPSENPAIVWFGHSSYLIHIQGKNILVDPVFSGTASPFSFMIKAYPGSNHYQVKDLPDIDLLIITHDHYDHLDYKTILELKPKIKHVYCSLGVGAHLEYWGIPENNVTELDWWDKKSYQADIDFICTPARHYTGRTSVRSKMLWSSFIIKTLDYTIFLGGDSGYDAHFKMIGDAYGPFDLAILECGQYNTAWPFIHMMPEETVQASLDLKAKYLMPVHWGKFTLAMHDWKEPIHRVLLKAKELNVQVVTPQIGEPVILGNFYPKRQWWMF